MQPAMRREIEDRLRWLPVPVDLVLPVGDTIGSLQAAVTLRFHDAMSLARLAAGQIGALGEAVVDGRIEGEGRARDLFAAVAALLWPGGLVLNHGITASGRDNPQLGAGLGDFIEKYIFPGGELLHVSRVLHDLAGVGLEMVGVENLRPHYARTLGDWSDALHQILAIRPDGDAGTGGLRGGAVGVSAPAGSHVPGWG